LSTILSWVKHGRFTDPLNQDKITSVKIWEIRGESFFRKRREDLEKRFMSKDKFEDDFFKSQPEVPLYEKRQSQQRSQRLEDL